MLRTLFLALLLIVGPGVGAILADDTIATAAVVEEARPSGFAPIDKMAGMALRHQIGFLWMDRVADGFFSLAPGEEPDTYHANLTGKTRGFSAWVTSHRIQIYDTVMKKQDDGRLITLTHDSSIERGKGDKKKIRTKHYAFDVEKNVIRISKTGDGQLMWEKEFEVEGEQMPVDILTAYYNFVTGIYGPIQPGARYVIPAFGGKDVGEIVIRVFRPEERPDNDFFPEGGTLCQVSVDKEIFDTKDGNILVWYDSNGLPSRGIVENIIGMGDIRGVMR